MTGLAGTSEMGQERLVDLASGSACSGTLALGFPDGTRLLLLDEGRVTATFDLGRPGTGDAKRLEFRFEPHPSSGLPQLCSAFPAATTNAMRALPLLGPGRELEPALVDLRSFVGRARAKGLTAALSVDGPSGRGLALFHQGRIGAAFFERDGHLWERSDALRVIYRYSLDADNPPMLLHRVEPELMLGLLGLALERRAGAGDPSRFNGVSAAEGGYTFYRDGQPLLHVGLPSKGPNGRFTPLDEVPDLELPDDPPGWESRRFQLTLRGRDALNPMTELAMRFEDNYGRQGKLVLDAVRRGLTIEDVAAKLHVDLQSLKPWIERLESDGLIRLRH